MSTSAICSQTTPSNRCEMIQRVGVSIIAALAAIALLSAILLNLAQQGGDLWSLNTIAREIDPRWLYTTMAVASTALLSVIAYTMIPGRSSGIPGRSSGKIEKSERPEQTPPAAPPVDMSEYTLPPVDMSEYTFEEVGNLLSSEQLDRVKDTEPELYYRLDLPMKENATRHIYAVVEGKAQYYFKKPEGREAHIRQALGGYISEKKLEAAIFDPLTGVITTRNLRNLFIADREYVICDIDVEGQMAFTIIFRDDEENFYYIFWPTAEARARDLNPTSKYGSDKGFIDADKRNKVAAMFRIFYHIDLILEVDGDYFIEKSKTTTYIYYRQNGLIVHDFIVSPQKPKDFVTEKGLKLDRRAILEDAPELPQRLGRSLCDLSKARSLEFLGEGEYFSREFDTTSRKYPKVYALAVGTAAPEWHFFTSEHNRTKLIEGQKLKEGLLREQNREKVVELAGAAIYARQKKPLLFLFELTGGKKSCLMLYQPGQELKKVYVPQHQVGNQLLKYNGSHFPVTLTTEPLTQEEIAYLDLSTALVKQAGNDLKAKEYSTTKSSSYYITLFSRDKDKGPLKMEHFRIDSAPYQQKLVALKDYKLKKGPTPHS